MRRTVGFIVGGLAVASLALTGCNSSSDSDEASPENVAEAGDFCQQVKEMNDNYLATIEKAVSENKTPDAATEEEINGQLISGLKQLQANIPEDASDEVKTAFSNTIDNFESGASPSEQSTQDGQTVNDFLTQECPELAASPEASAPVASPSN